MSKETSDQHNIKDLQLLMDNIKRKGNLSGVLFSNKEGSLITDNLDTPLDKSNFSSMCASVLESASSLGRSTGGLKLKKIITELESMVVIIIECTDDTFLALIADRNSKLKKSLINMDKFIRKIILIYEKR